MHLAYDSRTIPFAERSLFFACNSRQMDIITLKMLMNRCTKFYIKKEVNVEQYSDANIILVHDRFRPCKSWRTSPAQFSIPVIGITGSNGKTIVKEWLYQLLNDDLKSCAAQKVTTRKLVCH